MFRKILLVIFAVSAFPLYGQKLVEPAFELLSEYPNVRDFTIASTGDEAYFTVQNYAGDLSTIVFMKKENEQ